MSDKLLAQEEIDALLQKHNDAEDDNTGSGTQDTTSDTANSGDTPGAAASSNAASGAVVSGTAALDTALVSNTTAVSNEGLTAEEKDALGEIGNISLGSASTTLSELLGHKVKITSPRVMVVSREELLDSFATPYMVIEVKFKEGLKGFNLLILKVQDAAVLADLMMGGEGRTPAEELTDIEISATSEAMNQMIGSASTSLASIFGRTINILPPETMVLQVEDAADRLKIDEETLVTVSFRMSIEGFLDTTIMQVMGIETAKEEASLLLRGVSGEAGGAIPDAQEAGEAVSDTGGEREITTGVQGAEKVAAGGYKTKKTAVTRKVEEAAASTRVTGEMTAGTGEAGSESAQEYDQVHGDRSKEFSAKQGGIYGKSPQVGGIGANKSRGQAIPHPAMVRMAA
ncbi:MAG: flagellar motor switch phosphatase FliY, partial [Deltaproteobacteria bacterium]|nr:flagellar motor switch phosphatase FliY [Deltaproteobacteria bacterium]